MTKIFSIDSLMYVLRFFKHPKGYKRIYSLNIKPLYGKKTTKEMYKTLKKHIDVSSMFGSLREFEDHLNYSVYNRIYFRKINGVSALKFEKYILKHKDCCFEIDYIGDVTEMYEEIDTIDKKIESVSKSHKKALSEKDYEQAIIFEKVLVELENKKKRKKKSLGQWS